MSNGLLKLDVSKQNADEFVVITPTSVASVKGTSFILESTDDGDKFYGYEGIVEVLNKESNQVVRLSKNLKITSKPDGVINSEIITQNDAEIFNSFNQLDQDVEIEESETEDSGETDSESTNELKIKVYTSSGEEKIIIIKYTPATWEHTSLMGRSESAKDSLAYIVFLAIENSFRIFFHKKRIGPGSELTGG